LYEVAAVGVAAIAIVRVGVWLHVESSAIPVIPAVQRGAIGGVTNDVARAMSGAEAMTWH